jgi:hypothetical protein
MQFEVYRKTGRRELVLANDGGVNGRLNDAAGFLAASKILLQGTWLYSSRTRFRSRECC